MENPDLPFGGEKSSSPSFGEQEFTKEETDRIGQLLAQKLSKEQVSYRQGPGGQKVGYLEIFKAVELSNQIFHFNGWSTSIINISQDYLEEHDSKVSCGVSAVVRVQLKDGAYHEDIGYGISENMKSKGAALEKAKKEAVSDAVKRALRLFGNSLGNSVYDKEHLKDLKNQPANPPPNNQNKPTMPQGPPQQPIHAPVANSVQGHFNPGNNAMSQQNQAYQNAPSYGQQNQMGMIPAQNQGYMQHAQGPQQNQQRFSNNYQQQQR